jgi:hypothetical protein
LTTEERILCERQIHSITAFPNRQAKNQRENYVRAREANVDYSFNVEHAKAYGVEEAIMLHNFIYWLRHNKANNKNQNDGHTWTYNSVRAFRKLFPFWSKGQIDRIIRSLVSQGVLLKGEYNQANYDKTSWYALADESLLQIDAPKEDAPISRNQEMDFPESGNRSPEIKKPIPDLKPDSKPDKKQERVLPCFASLPEKEAHNTLREELLALSRETIGSETQYVDQAVKLVRAGEDPNEVKAGFGEMLRRRPAGAPFFAKDYPTHWKPKAKDSQDKAKKRICQSCGKEVTVTSSQCPLCRDPIDGSLKRRREELKRAEAERAGKDLIALQLADLEAKAAAGSRFAADRLKRATA